MAASRLAMWLSALAGIFLAFGWPFVVSADPSSEVFHVAAVGTLVVFLLSVAACLLVRRG
ncbi:MAG: hypothetical protein H7Y14_07315 [Burkholderiales bacterium]|nr:hypothetical protein [Burkholderiales bacterium]